MFTKNDDGMVLVTTIRAVLAMGDGPGDGIGFPLEPGALSNIDVARLSALPALEAITEVLDDYTASRPTVVSYHSPTA